MPDLGHVVPRAFGLIGTPKVPTYMIVNVESSHGDPLLRDASRHELLCDAHVA